MTCFLELSRLIEFQEAIPVEVPKRRVKRKAQDSESNVKTKQRKLINVGESGKRVQILEDKIKLGISEVDQKDGSESKERDIAGVRILRNRKIYLTGRNDEVVDVQKGKFDRSY